MPRDEARRVLGVRWSRKPEVTDFKVDRKVVWRCVQVKNYSFFHFHSNIIHCDNVKLFCTDCTIRRWQLGPSMTVSGGGVEAAAGHRLARLHSHQRHYF